MSEIDWSKAPEGATHWAPAHESFNGVWARLEDGVYKFMCYNGQWLSGAQPLHGEKFIERPQAWSGDGLPPVGAVCEWNHEANDDWHAAQILYIGNVYVIVTSYDGEQHYYLRSIKFRPIRTPEQIAAEELQLAVQQIMADAGVTDSAFKDDPEAWVWAAALHKAGYRKQ